MASPPPPAARRATILSRDDRGSSQVLEGFAAGSLVILALLTVAQTKSVLVPLSEQTLDVNLELAGKDALYAIGDSRLAALVGEINTSYAVPSNLSAEVANLLPARARANYYLGFVNNSTGLVHYRSLSPYVRPPENGVTVRHYLVLYNDQLASTSPLKVNLSNESSGSTLPRAALLGLELWWL
ncbi:MAG: hypothetical protein QXT68_01875 [Halobacteria archaeon]